MAASYGRSAAFRKSRTFARGTSTSLTASISWSGLSFFSWMKIQPVSELTYWRTASTDASLKWNVSFFSS